MKKTYKLENLGCANCANLMGEHISKLDGVSNAKVNFMLSKLTVEVEEGKEVPSKEELQNVIKKIENQCVIL
ncbi:MAG: heavy metal transporter [Tissierellia bacterium]|nr:heavy metal transporter [Tissierellia bacterium]